MLEELFVANCALHRTCARKLLRRFPAVNGGAGTNLKVGAHVRRKALEYFLDVHLHFFGFTSTISRFGERFRHGQYSLASFLFAVLLTVPPPRSQPILKVGRLASAL